MNELAHTTPPATASPTVLDGLALQARTFAQNAALNLLQLGRVLTEAKPLVPHGEWGAWIRTNALMGERTAQSYMQAYAEFGVDSKIAELGTTKIVKLLPMAPEERDALMRENDISAMTTRELDRAIREQREKLRKEAQAEAAAEIERERKARLDAEQRARDLENRPAEVPEELLTELQQQRQTIQTQGAEIQRLANLNRDGIAERRRLQGEISDRDALLEEQQAEYDRVQNELLDLQSAQARGDAERAPADELTVEVFSAAVRQFIGTCARLPHMGRAFCTMPTASKSAYDELLRVVEGWTAGARKALESVSVEGGFVNE